MKHVQFGTYGGPEVLDVVEGPIPEPGPGQICIRAEAIGVGIPDIPYANRQLRLDTTFARGSRE